HETAGEEDQGLKAQEWRRQLTGLFVGLILAVLVYVFFPSNSVETVMESTGADPEGAYTYQSLRLVAATTVLMGAWWMTEAIPLAATALRPLVIFPITCVAEFSSVGGPYASSTLFLCMGGVLLARGLQCWNLDRRLALYVVKIVGTS